MLAIDSGGQAYCKRIYLIAFSVQLAAMCTALIAVPQMTSYAAWGQGAQGRLGHNNMLPEKMYASFLILTRSSRDSANVFGSTSHSSLRLNVVCPGPSQS